MIAAPLSSESIKTTSYKVVLPFYLYAAFAFLISAVLLLSFGSAFLYHYFQPHILAITHLMALGWGTMIILGASHQLVPVIIEGKLYSNALAYISFILAAIGIPMLVYSFYVFNLGEPAQCGGILVVLAIIAYLINLAVSISKSKSESIHAIFVFTSVIWLLFTASLGLTLIYNFTGNILPQDSLHYLPLHVHMGVIGWFLLLVMGVGSRLIPMFMISKYTNVRLLKWIFVLINTALIAYILIFYLTENTELILLPWLLLLTGIILFTYYCFCAFKKRIRKNIDEPVKMSLLSVFMMIMPLILLFISILTVSFISRENISLSLSYGFLIFFGWLTAIILGMTFKTLPFIIWNKVYHHRSGASKTPNPKDLFNTSIFKIMSVAYLFGLVLFLSGCLIGILILLQSGAALILIAAILYVYNVLKVVMHQAQRV